MRSAETRRANFERRRVGRHRDRIFMPTRVCSCNVGRNFRHIDHFLAANRAERDDARVARAVGDIHYFERVLRNVEIELNFLFKTTARDADRKFARQNVGTKDGNARFERGCKQSVFVCDFCQFAS